MKGRPCFPIAFARRRKKPLSSFYSHPSRSIVRSSKRKRPLFWPSLFTWSLRRKNVWTVSGQQQQEQHKKRCSLHIFYAHAAFDVRRPFLPFYTLSLPPEFIHSFFSKEREGEAGCKKGKKRPLSPPQYRGFAKNVSEVTQWSQMINAFIFLQRKRRMRARRLQRKKERRERRRRQRQRKLETLRRQNEAALKNEGADDADGEGAKKELQI